MPTYELVLAFKKLEQSALKAALKRSAKYIFDVDGTLRNIENLGFRSLPYSISQHGMKHKFAHFFIFNYDLGEMQVKNLKEQLKLDLDIVRARNWMRAENPMKLHDKKEKPECTRHLDLLPPPLRPKVIEIQNFGKKKEWKPKGKNFDDYEFLVY